MERYKDIDVPEFMKNKKKETVPVEVQIEKAYFKGALLGMATTFFLIGSMIFIAVVEMI